MAILIQLNLTEEQLAALVHVTRWMPVLAELRTVLLDALREHQALTGHREVHEGEGPVDHGAVYDDACGCPRCEAFADQVDNADGPLDGFIRFDRTKLAEFTQAYADAVASGASNFLFEGREVLADYAKYVIEYVENALDVIDPSPEEVN